jgi:hypothetical protein
LTVESEPVTVVAEGPPVLLVVVGIVLVVGIGAVLLQQLRR